MFWLVGLVVAAYILLRVIKRIFPSKIVDLKALPRWAVVTGATDGIGKAFTHNLAAKGFNIVLMSRNEYKLKAAAGFIERHFGVSTVIIQADFANLDELAYGRFRSELREIEIGVLINNVGTDGGHQEYFVELENHHSTAFRDVVNVNVTAAVNLTRLVLPGMVERGKGLIINVSSRFSLCPAPMITLYGATKSFLNKFSEDLNLEVRNKGVHVHVLTTGPVATKFACVLETSFFRPSPATYVESALEDVTRHVRCTGYPRHTLLAILASTRELLIPGSVGESVMKRFLSSLDKARNECDKCNTSF